jgi:hypothetical protein
MSRLLATSRRLAFGVAALALVASWTASGARANIAYAYAEETVTITSSPDIIITGTSALSQTAANLNGVFAQSGTVPSTDAPQSFVGPHPGENSFVKFATFAHDPALAGDLPLTPGASFARGDVLLAVPSGSAVSEVYLNGPGQVGGGDGNNHITYTFTVGTTGVHNIGYSFTTDLYAVTNSPGDSANGTVSFGVILKQDGNVLSLTGVDPRTSNTLSSPPNSNEMVTNGTGTLVTPVLTAGVEYTVVFSLDANTNAATVPEPATMAMALTALPLLGFGLLRRRNRKAQA